MTILLHGFWGQPADWNLVLSRLPLGAPVLIPDLYEEPHLAPELPLKVWTERFASWVQHVSHDQPVDLIGYSMGGRLALNAVTLAPNLFRRVLLLSARPFLAREEAPRRRKWEADWAQLFLSEPWEDLEKKWEQESVFRDSLTLAHRHSPALRRRLGQSLINWSVCDHLCGPEDLAGLAGTVDWAFGARDQNYVALATTLRSLGVKGKISVLPDAGHRLHLAAPEFMSQWLADLEARNRENL